MTENPASENPTPETPVSQPSVSTATWLGPARKRAFVAAGLLLAVGGALALAPKPTAVQHDEAWVASALPTEFSGFRMAPAQDPTRPYCTYKMDDNTYTILRPWGIVPRIFQKENESYDVVVIGSNTKDSFHDPAVCFSAQGWNLTNARQEMLDTKAYGQIPVTMVDMDREGSKTIAMYFYRLRDGYVASNAGVKKQMLLYKLTPPHIGRDDEGGFIRIIPNGSADPKKLKQFAADWVDAASKSSHGYY